MDKMREGFEAWCLRENGFTPQRSDDNDGYRFDTTDDMWRAWKASRAARRVEFPGSWYKDREGNVLNREDDTKQALDDAGVSYK